jgi:uncharacterized protein (TIGR02145 family)
MKSKTLVVIFTAIFILLISYCSDPSSDTESENTPPTASFIFAPTLGDTTTVFTFDATNSSDKEDSASTLEVRWDWDNNGTWDTEYSTSKIAYHQFNISGVKTVTLEVKDSGGLADSSSRQLSISIPNTPPIGSFVFSPSSGDTTTLFEFDASGSSDKEDSTAALEVRWDWEHDGTWDTDYSTTKIVYHKFGSEGTKSITMEVRDTEGLSDTSFSEVVVTLPNQPPVAAFTLNPDSASIFIEVNFDASLCYDNEDPTYFMRVRWDWENDGIWDTKFDIAKVISHKFETKGDYTIKLEVLDTGNLSGFTTQQVNVVGEAGTVTDIDSNVYKTVKIGNQWWMAENLKVTHYRNGDEILHLPDNTDWGNTTSGAYCVYGNNESNFAAYGLLYNGYVLDDSRNVAPEGWHIPTDAEWKELEIFLGMSPEEANKTFVRGTDEGGKLKETGTIYWLSPNGGATNFTGFSARGGGSRNQPGLCEYLRQMGYWWASTPSNSYPGSHYGRFINSTDSIIGRGQYIIEAGMSIRCVKD